MEKSVKITLIIVIGIIIVAILGFLFFSPTNTQNTVTVNGQATIKAIPDLVGVYFNVETQGKTSKEAKDKNAEIADKLIAELLKQGFDRKEIQTLNFNINPEYDWTSGSQKLIGYKAVHSIKVELSTEKSEKIGTVIDAGVNAGSSVSYINFELSQDKQNSYKAEAMKLAGQDATIKAESIASGLGKKLGKLVSVSSTDFNYYPWRLYDASAGATTEMAKQATTNIQPGEQEISANIQAVFKLK